MEGSLNPPIKTRVSAPLERAYLRGGLCSADVEATADTPPKNSARGQTLITPAVTRAGGDPGAGEASGDERQQADDGHDRQCDELRDRVGPDEQYAARDRQREDRVEMAALLRADDRRGERADRRVAHRQRQDQAEPETTSGWVCLTTATNCCSRVGSR